MLLTTPAMPLAVALLFCLSADHTSGRIQQSVDRGGTVTDGFRIFIEAQRGPFPEGGPITVVFHTKNVDSMCRGFGIPHDWYYGYPVDVRTEAGQTIKPFKDVGPAQGAKPGWLEPRQEFVLIGNLADLYSLPEGTYLVTVRTYAVSNTIRIQVASRGDNVAPSSGLSLSLPNQNQQVYDPLRGLGNEWVRLRNSADHDIKIALEDDRVWFHQVIVDVRTLAGDTVARKRDASGEEVSLEKSHYNRSAIFSGAIKQGEQLDGELLLSRAYNLSPGTSYLLTARFRAQTSDGPVDLVSNTVIIVIEDDHPPCGYCCAKESR
ncbi:MAG TPA: hypothetical protein VI756_18625 [Blastocatellia bacterium]